MELAVKCQHFLGRALRVADATLRHEFESDERPRLASSALKTTPMPLTKFLENLVAALVGKLLFSLGSSP